MKTIVKEIRVETKNPTGNPFCAVVRDGEVTFFDTLISSLPSAKKLEAYISFLLEVLEAIEETK